MTQDYPVIVESPSDRSKCQSCREFIALGSYRVGLPYYHGGFTVVKWHHPSCFKRHCLLVDYAPTGRAKDTSDGTPISEGQPRLVIGEGASYRKYRHARLEHRTSISIPEADLPLTRLNLALHRTYKPQNGAPFLADLSEHVRVRPETIAGVDELVPEHRAWLVAALSGLAVGPTPIRATPPTKAELEAEANVLAVATVTLTLTLALTLPLTLPLTLTLTLTLIESLLKPEPFKPEL